MNTIVDTSVWSLALRRHNPVEDPQCKKLEDMIKLGQPIILLGVILQELLQGIRNPATFKEIQQHLESFPLLILDREDYVAAAELRNQCQSLGVQASTVDFQIATACIRHNCALLTSDGDFYNIAKCCELQFV